MALLVYIDFPQQCYNAMGSILDSSIFLVILPLTFKHNNNNNKKNKLKPNNPYYTNIKYILYQIILFSPTCDGESLAGASSALVLDCDLTFIISRVGCPGRVELI